MGKNGKLIKHVVPTGSQSKPLPEEEAREIARLYEQGHTLKSLREEFHHGDVRLRAALVSLGVEIRPPADSQYTKRPDPTPEEIEQGIEKIKQGWSEKERDRRAGVERVPYTIPEVSFGPRRNGVVVNIDVI